MKFYYLKYIILYCILFLIILCEENKLFSVREVFGYFVNYFELFFNVKNLLYFFYGNFWFGFMLLGSFFEREKVKYNFFVIKDIEILC